MSTKMKGLFKGLRLISQIFEEEKKDPDFQIGYPTDVKHVGHIGWEGDGPSANTDSPSWLNEFKAPEYACEPSSQPSESKENGSSAPKWISRKDSNSQAQESPRSKSHSRRRSTDPNSSSEGSVRRRSEKSRMHISRRKKLEDSSSEENQESSQAHENSDTSDPTSSGRTRRRRSKESSVTGSSRSSRKASNASKSNSTESDHVSESGVSKLTIAEVDESSLALDS